MRWGSLLAAASLAALSVPAQAAQSKPHVAASAASSVLEKEMRARSENDLLPFYAARAYRPLWVANGTLSPAASALLQLVQTSRYDGLGPASVPSAELEASLRRLEQERSESALANAEITLSRTLVRYVTAIRRLNSSEMIYEHDSLRPQVPTAADVLRDLSSAPSLANYVSEMRWMHPLYAPLRKALTGDQLTDPSMRYVVMRNLERIRALPPLAPGKRHVLVDVASARLWMYEDGRPVDSMKVVVGKADAQTPIMSGYIRYAVVNPYWNVPKDLVVKNIATNVIGAGGMNYLKARGYEVLSDWGPSPSVIDPASVDWRAVAKGGEPPRVRQLPGTANFMGKVKFEFPNQQGIYLHDTPDKKLLLEDRRQLSSGCIRLEDAQRLGRWLFRGALPEMSSTPEQKVDLPNIVPIYVTYLTARPDNGRIALSSDPYNFDGSRRPMLAEQGKGETMFRHTALGVQ